MGSLVAPVFHHTGLCASPATPIIKLGSNREYSFPPGVYLTISVMAPDRNNDYSRSIGERSGLGGPIGNQSKKTDVSQAQVRSPDPQQQRTVDLFFFSKGHLRPIPQLRKKGIPIVPCLDVAGSPQPLPIRGKISYESQVRRPKQGTGSHREPSLAVYDVTLYVKHTGRVDELWMFRTSASPCAAR